MNAEVRKLDFDVNTLSLNSKDLLTKVFTLVKLKPDDTGYIQDFKVEKEFNNLYTTIFCPIPIRESLSTTENLTIDQQNFALKTALAYRLTNNATDAIINLIAGIDIDNSLIGGSVVNTALHAEHVDEEKVENDYIDYVVHKLIKDSGLSDNPRITNIKPVFITDSYSFHKLSINNKITQLNRDSVVITPHAFIQDKLIIVFNYDYKKDDGSVVRIMFGTIPYYDFAVENNTVVPRYRILVNTPVVAAIYFRETNKTKTGII